MFENFSLLQPSVVMSRNYHASFPPCDGYRMELHSVIKSTLHVYRSFRCVSSVVLSQQGKAFYGTQSIHNCQGIDDGTTEISRAASCRWSVYPHCMFIWHRCVVLYNAVSWIHILQSSGSWCNLIDIPSYSVFYWSSADTSHQYTSSSFSSCSFVATCPPVNDGKC